MDRSQESLEALFNASYISNVNIIYPEALLLTIFKHTRYDKMEHSVLLRIWYWIIYSFINRK